MHAIERARHRRAQERAIVLKLIEPEREDAAILGDRGLGGGDAVGTGACRDQMLDAVLGPFHRPAGDLRRERHQHDIGKYRKLDAEAAAGIRRNPQPQFRPRYAQRPRHHRMDRERTLEIRQHVVAALRRIMLRDHDVTFDRRKRQPRKRRRHRDAEIGAGEGFRGVAIREVAHRDFVGLRFRMQKQRGAVACRDRIEHRFERLVIDLDQFGSVLGDIAAIRHHQRHRLADIAHPLDRERPLLHRSLHRGEEWIGELAHLLRR